jgi:DNA recombination protein RmuC
MKMEWVLLIIGIAVGAGVVALFSWLRARAVKDLAAKSEQAFRDMVDTMKGTFATLSLDALSKNSEEFLRLAREKLSAQAALGDKELEGKKKLIDETLAGMKSEMQRVETLMRALEKDRENKFSELSTSLKGAAEQTARLQVTADQLRSVLANTKQRGHLGERIAEDVLKLSGFVANINYKKQETQGEGRPDYTFFMPKDLKINMDVKFPLNNYTRYIESESPMEKENFKKLFLSDARQRIKEVTTRDYINPEGGTVNYVLVFIPSEQAFAFIQEADRTIFDEALKQKVICSSPLTLYAILVTIRRTESILLLLSSFNKQWDNFVEAFEELGRRIDATKKEYDSLITTRRNQLDRQLRKIEDLREQKDLELGEGEK